MLPDDLHENIPDKISRNRSFYRCLVVNFFEIKPEISAMVRSRYSVWDLRSSHTIGRDDPDINNSAVMQLFYPVYLPQTELMRDCDIGGTPATKPFCNQFL